MRTFGKISIFIIISILFLGCDQKLEVTKNFKISNFILEIYNKQNKQDFLLIAHAGGGINGFNYTNSIEAVNNSILNGYNLIEIDLIETRDAKLVGAHDWDHFKSISNCCKNNQIPSLKEFKNYKIYKDLSTLDYSKINEIFIKNKNLILVTDKTNNFKLINNLFTFDKDRIIVEIFGRDNYFKAIEENIKNPMYSTNIGELDFVKKYNIKLIAVHSKDFIANKNAYIELSENVTIIFVYSSNDVKFIYENKNIVNSFYSDFIDIKNNKCVSNVCETY